MNRYENYLFSFTDFSSLPLCEICVRCQKPRSPGSGRHCLPCYRHLANSRAHSRNYAYKKNIPKRLIKAEIKIVKNAKKIAEKMINEVEKRIKEF